MYLCRVYDPRFQVASASVCVTHQDYMSDFGNKGHTLYTNTFLIILYTKMYI